MKKHLIATLATALAITGQSYGEPVFILKPEPGSIYHHTGFLSGRSNGHRRKRTSEIHQRQIRKNRRRAHAAGVKNAFR